jgi:hypothetical protein
MVSQGKVPGLILHANGSPEAREERTSRKARESERERRGSEQGQRARVAIDNV